MARLGATTNTLGFTLPTSGKITASMLQRLLTELSVQVNVDGIGSDEIAEVPWSKMATGSLPEGVILKSFNYSEDGTGNCASGWALKANGTIVSPGLNFGLDGTVTMGVTAFKFTALPNGDFQFGTGGASVNITHDAMLYIGGTDPTTAPFMVDKSGAVTVRASAGIVHQIDLSAISGTVQPPVFSPTSTNFDTSVSVTLVNQTAGSDIYYTVDGSTPSSASTHYTGAFAVSGSGATVVKAIAIKFGMSSGVASATYTKNASVGDVVANPTFDPVPGTYSPTGGGQAVVIACVTSGATIRYTIDGSTPSSSVGTIIASGASVTLTTGTTTLKALAYKGGSTDSGVTSGDYVVNSGGTGDGSQVALPEFVKDSGSYGVNTVSGHLICATSGVTFHYRKWNGSSWGAWTVGSAFSVNLNRSAEFYASKAGLLDSDHDFVENDAGFGGSP